MIDISMKQLRYFAALAQSGHFGGAAQACSISQPALSQQIKELEQKLGETLVERNARRVRLTRLGVELAQRARAILRSVDELGELARSQRQSLSGRLGLGVIPTVAPYLLPSLVNRLTADFPEVKLIFREAVTQRLIKDLLEGQLDIAIVALPLSAAGLHEQALFDEEFVLVRPPGHATAPVPGQDKLRTMQLLLLEEGHCFRDQALSYCAITPEAMRDQMDGNSLTTLVQMVGTGIGVTLIPRMAVDMETRAASVSVARLEKPAPTRTIGMVWRESSPLAEHYKLLADVVGKAGLALTEAQLPPSVRP